MTNHQLEGDDASILGRAYLDALSRMDLPAIMAVLDRDIQLEYPFEASGDTRPGATRVIRGYSVVEDTLRAGLPLQKRIRFDVESVSLSAAGDTSFIECRGDVVMRDGRLYRNRYVFRFDSDQGLITRIREYMNPVTAALAFGRPIAGQHFTDPPI